MITDSAQRQQAVTTSGHAFVWASAGTGKTHTLTLRALFLLLTAPFDKRAKGTDCAMLYHADKRADRLRAARAAIRRFALTTFTRKAAAEMQTRLYEYLDLLAGASNFEALREQVAQMNSGRGDEQFIEVVECALKQAMDFEALRAGAEALAELATELPVCTLHSFAAAVLRRHPIAAGIPPMAQFAEENETTAPDVDGQVIERWWQHVLADETLRKELGELSKTITIAQMSDWLEAVFEHPWIAQEMEFDTPDAGTVQEIRAACDALVNHPNAMGLTDVEDLRAVLAVTPFSWGKFCDLIHEKRAKLFLDRLAVDKAKKLQIAIRALPANHRRYFESVTAIYPHILGKCLADEHDDAWAHWRNFVAKFATWADGAAIRELSVVTFDEMVRLAAKLLRTNEAVRREERTRLWAILVDEFQDTDPVQLQLLEELLRRDSPGDHELKGFFVGDPKQSIYRFRGADLPAIESFVDRYPKVVHAGKSEVCELQLTASFRSQPAITNFVNAFFETSVPLPNYRGEKLNPVRSETGVTPEWRLLKPHAIAQSASAQREFAAWETARLIEEYKSADGNGDDAYSDIIVLARTHTEMDALLPILEAAGIPVVSSGAKTFYRQPEVLDALNLLIALHNPHDPLAVGALLRSPLFGLSDEQIYRVLQDTRTSELFRGENTLLPSVPDGSRSRVEQMRALARERNGLGLAEWLRRVRQFVPAGVYAQQDSEGRAVVRIENVLTAYRSVVELGAIAPLAWLLEQRARADRGDDFDADLGEDVSVTDESMAAVRVMTIHKAKGLQGKYVIVYGWQTTLDKREPERTRRKKPLCLTAHGGQIVRGYELDWGQLTIVSPSYPQADTLNQQLEADEAKRLAYVAATRAKDRLLLLSPHTGELTDGLLAEVKPAIDGGASSATAVNATLQATIVESRKGEPRYRESALQIENPAAYGKIWLDRAADLAQLPEAMLHRPSQPERVEEEDEAEVADYIQHKIQEAREISMQAGTLVHRYLERHLTEAELDESKFEQIIGEDDGEKSIERARAVLHKFFCSPLHTRAMKATILGREAPIYLTVSDKPWGGVMDLIIEENGVITGVDHKVMEKPSVLMPEYEQQQQIYTEALHRLFPGRNVSFEFWWLA
jgi:ATP-dependent helicase/nuclease subunit A